MYRDMKWHLYFAALWTWSNKSYKHKCPDCRGVRDWGTALFIYWTSCFK